MTIFGLGATIGGPLSGALADAYGWRAAFWVQLPAVTWCASVVGTFLPEPPHGTPSHASVWAGLRALDWRGIGLLLGSVSALISGLSLHASFFRPWCDPAVVGLLLASVVGAIAFVGVEANAELPIVPLSMFKSAQLVYIWLASMFLAMSSSAFLFHVPMFFAVMRDEPASSAGVVVSICSGIGASTGTLFAGQ